MSTHSTIGGAAAARLLTAAAIFAVALRLSAGPGLDLDLVEVGHWPDTPRGVAVSGGYAYCAIRDRLVVLDLTDPARTHQVGAYQIVDPELGGSVERVWVSGDYAWVSSGRQHDMEVIDIRSPVNPRPLGGITLSPSAQVRDMAFSASHAYAVASGLGRLFVLDLSDPAKPQLVGDYVPALGPSAVEVSGDHAFLAVGEGGLEVLDISNRTKPRRIATYLPKNDAGETVGVTDVALSGQTAYLSAGILDIVDVSDPSAPKRLGMLMSSSAQLSGGREISVFGAYACVQVGFTTELAPPLLHVIDVRDPARPRVVGFHHSEHAIVAPPYAAVIEEYGHNQGLRILDLRRWANPQALGTYPGLTGPVVTSGNLAFFAAGGLSVFDWSDPTNLKKVGAYETKGVAMDVALSGNLAFLAVQGDEGLLVLDIADPAHPRRIGAYHPPHEASISAVVLLNQHAFVLESWWQNRTNLFTGLGVLDIRDPASPRRIGELEGDFESLAVSEGRLVASSVGEPSLVIIDVTDPSHPRQLGDAKGVGLPVSGVATQGHLAFMAALLDSQDGVRSTLNVFDLSNPGQPRLLGSAEFPSGNGVAVAASERYVYLTEYTHGLQVFDISDPANPRRVGGNSTVMFNWHLALAGDKILATGWAGLTILNAFEPLRLQTASGNQGNLNLTVSGPPDWPLRVQRSADLKSWQDWQSMLLSDGPIQLAHPEPASQPRQFYRAVAP